MPGPTTRTAPRPRRTALVLSGGGARGAYQAGVLSGLVDLGVIADRTSPFDVMVGSSAGSINAGMLAAYADRLATGVERLVEVWSALTTHEVFRTDLRSLGRIGARWAWDLSFGGAAQTAQPKALLDTAPLRQLLDRIPFARIEANVQTGALRALAVAATDLHTATGYLFIHGGPDIRLWQRSRWHIERARITIDHLMASSAIPIFFPSIEIGGRHFGDGCIRNTTPLSPAINLGADRIVTIGVQGPGRAPAAPSEKLSPPSIAQIAGVLLDAVMLDAIEADIEHSVRVNHSVLSCRESDAHHPFRRVDVLWLRPSHDFNSIADQCAEHVPPILRYLMRGLGRDESLSDLLSYLLFHPAYATRLIALGRSDVLAARDEILHFLERGVTDDRADVSPRRRA